MIQDHHLYRLINEELFNVVEKEPQIEKIIEKPLVPLAVLTSPLNKHELDNLKKTLTALKVNFENVKIAKSIDELNFHPEKLIVFGDEFKNFLEVNALYTPTKTKYGEVFISRPLSFLAEDQNEKIKFWEALKNWFVRVM